MAHLHRRGLSLFKGRRAVAIWLLAALLHGPAITGADSTYASPALAEVVTTLVQIAASAAVGLGLALLGGTLRRLFAPRLVVARAVGRRRTRPFDPSRSLFSASRPPPSLASLAF